MDPQEYPLCVYDLFRCKKVYTNEDELNSDLKDLNEKYPVTRIKNKTGTHLSLVHINYAYTLPNGGELICEMQMLLDRGNFGLAPVQEFNHLLFQIIRSLDPLYDLQKTFFLLEIEEAAKCMNTTDERDMFN